MEELIVWLSQYIPETYATILVTICSIIIMVVYKSVKSNNVMLKTTVKERFDNTNNNYNAVVKKNAELEEKLEDAEKRIAKLEKSMKKMAGGE